MFWGLEKHAKTTANTRMQPKIPSLLIYEVLIDYTLNRAAMFFFRPSLLREYGTDYIWCCLCTFYYILVVELLSKLRFKVNESYCHTRSH